MTERFNANSEGTNISSSGIGPTGSGSSLVALGLGQGPGQTANNQENNQFAQFEYPIKWDDLANALGRLGEKQKVDELLDDMSTRDRILEDFLNTNVVNGIVAGTNITIDRASGVVTITAVNQLPQAWTAWTPTLVTAIPSTVTLVSNASRYIQIGKTIHAKLHCKVTLSASDTVIGYKAPVNNFATGLNYEASVGTYYVTASIAQSGVLTITENAATTGYVRFRYATAPTGTSWELGATITYEAA